MGIGERFCVCVIGMGVKGGGNVGVCVWLNVGRCCGGLLLSWWWE